MLDYVWTAIGLGILVVAGECLVRGAVNVSLRLGVPALIVSLTVVAFGTSAPELLVAIQATLDNAPGIALGNVVGSNTANVLLVLGIPAVISGIAVYNGDTVKSYLTMIATSVLFIAVCSVGPIGWLHGLVLLTALTVILYDQGRTALAARRAGGVDIDPNTVEGANPDMPWWKILVFLGLGLIGLPLGANLLIDGATNIARDFGVSEVVIGLSLVAIGTSLPELATSVVAAFKKQADVALGNVIGSNIFNLLAIVGIASLIKPLTVDPVFLEFDLWVMLGASMLLAPFVLLYRNISTIWGLLFCSGYGGYLWLLVP